MNTKPISRTLSESIEGWTIAARARRLSINTLNDYSYSFRRFQAFIGRDLQLAAITTDDIKRFMAGLDGLSDSNSRFENFLRQSANFCGKMAVFGPVWALKSFPLAANCPIDGQNGNCWFTQVVIRPVANLPRPGFLPCDLFKGLHHGAAFHFGNGYD